MIFNKHFKYSDHVNLQKFNFILAFFSQGDFNE